MIPNQWQRTSYFEADVELATWFERLWDDYSKMTPNVSKISDLLEARGEVVENDHIAFRTLDLSPISISDLEPLLINLGYTPFDDYAFEDKKLNARSYVQTGWPRVFLSELRTADFPEWLPLFQSMVSGIKSGFGPEIFWSGRLWGPITFKDFQTLSKASEYAAWFTALGLRPNHFTVSVNALKTFAGIQELSEWVQGEGYPMNTAGGLIKGTPADFLEQSSTLADRIPIEFTDGFHDVPTCYYEFALRHIVDNTLFDGFVTSSANRIFESTTTNT